MSKLIIINGPNLNLLGQREQSQYGSKDYNHLTQICNEKATELNLNLSHNFYSKKSEEVINMEREAFTYAKEEGVAIRLLNEFCE